MPFLPLIPQANDQLSVSQGNILNNFTVLGAIAGNVNASSASLNTTSGFNWIYLPSQAGSPPAGAAFPAGQIGLYSFIATSSTRRELHINKTNQSGVVQIPMTASILGTVTPGINSNGWTYLPSGIILKWGFVSLNGVVSGTTFNFPVGAGIKAFTQCFNVTTNLGYNSTTTAFNTVIAISTATVITNTGFTITFSGGAWNANSSMYYFAIGY